MQTYMVKVLRVGEPVPSMRVTEPSIVQRYWNKMIKQKDWFDENKEHLIVLLVSTQLSIQGCSLVSIGSLNESLAHPREIFRAAVACGAYGIILIHNHPGGDPTPSDADKLLTRRLEECAELLQIKLVDHVIIGQPNRQMISRLDAVERALVRRRTHWGRRRQEVKWNGLDALRKGFYSFKEMGGLRLLQ